MTRESISSSGPGGDPEAADALLRRGRAALAAQPFSVWLNARLERLQPGEAELHLPWRHELLQQNGFLHGGVLSYAADNTLTLAGATLLGPQVLTGEFKINYLRPAPEGLLMALAQVVHAGRSQAVCRCDVYVRTLSGESRLCATAQGTIVRLLAPSERVG